MNSLLEKDKPKIQGEVAIYAGRFQPFHKGHYAAYQNLVNEFGSANVYIATSNDTSSDKSPFSFNEKKEIATKMFGVPSTKFVKVNNPYRPVEILKKYDGQTIAYIAAVGEKDATRLQGKYFKPYKGKAGYGYDEIGYTYPIPAEENPISGTEVRNGLGNNDKEKAKKFFLKAYPKFDKDIFKMITSKLNEDFPGGIGVGLNLPGGYINGAPTGSVDESNNTNPSYEMRPEPHPTRHEKEHPSDEPDWHKKNDPYDPISEIIERVITNEMFEVWAQNYFEEDVNKALDVEIPYTDSKGRPKKIKARNALRLPKEHPAHVQAAKILGPDDAPVNEPKKKEEPGKAATQSDKPAQPGQPTKKDQTAQGKIDKEQPNAAGITTPGEEQGPPPEQKLSGTELKSSAETTPADKIAAQTKDAIDKARKEMSAEDNKDIDLYNNPESPERKNVVDTILKGVSKFGKGIKNWFHHKKEIVGGTMDALISLSKTGKIGTIKDKDGKRRHWSEFTSVGPDGKKEYEEVETDVLDSHGQPTGKKKKEKKPKISESATDEQKKLFEASWKETKKQKKDMWDFAFDSALILGSIALGAFAVGGVKAAVAGKGLMAALSAGSTSTVGAFTHGATSFGLHLGKDIIKHASFETLGLQAHHAPFAGAGLSAATGGILESIDTNKENGSQKFISNFIGKVIEKMKTYKLSDEQLLKSIEDYKKNKPKQNAANLLRENISESKQNSINHFVEYATKKLKLKEQPKITLVSGKEYSEAKTSLGGYNPMSKEIYVAIEGRLTADILRTLAHEMVHRKQDELGLVRDEVKDGATGSPIENQAHAVAGILMRNYGKINKQIYNENINVDVNKGDEVLMGKFKNKKVTVKDIGTDDHGMPTINGKQATTFRIGKKGQNIYEMGNKDIHFKNIIKLYRDSKYRKRINAFLFGNPNHNNPNDVARELRNMGYDDITRMEKELNIEPDLNEVSNVATANTADVPDGSFIKKGKKRKLNTDKSEDWYKNGGYTQTEFPKADAIFGDEDAEERTITYSIKNLPDIEYVKTEFIKEGLLMEGGAYGHMSHPFDDMDLTFGDLKNIITKALNGDLGVVREKTDGQALAISWKNGRLIAARNKGNLANAGENAMGIEDVASKFGGRGGLTDAYNFAMKDLSAAIQSLSEAQRKKIFNEGKCFMNLEVIWPDSVNVIPYGQALLVFHNTTCYNEKGEAIGADGSAASTLAGMIKQVNADVQSKYTIQGPPITSIPKSADLSSKQGKYLSKLNKLQSEFHLKDNDNVADYHQSWWDWWITSNSPVKVDKLTKESLIRRWAFGDKSFRLNTISNVELQKWAMQNDKVNVAKQQKENIKPFEEIFLGVGADVLDFVGSVLTVHPENAIRAMKQKFKQVADQVRTAGNPTQIQKLKSELERLNQLGGIDKIVANEGLVFFYNGKTYKLTGTFAPLNQILGIFYS